MSHGQHGRHAYTFKTLKNVFYATRWPCGDKVGVSKGRNSKKWPKQESKTTYTYSYHKKTIYEFQIKPIKDVGGVAGQDFGRTRRVTKKQFKLIAIFVLQVYTAIIVKYRCWLIVSQYSIVW